LISIDLYNKNVLIGANTQKFSKVNSSCEGGGGG